MAWNKKSRYPVSSFGAELMAALLRGAKEEFRIPCENRQQMRALQARIHQLRAAMNRENHPQYQLVTKVRTSQDWKVAETSQQPYDFGLILRPQDSQFAGILAKAGVTVEKSDKDLLEEATTPIVVLPQDDTNSSPSNPYEKFK